MAICLNWICGWSWTSQIVGEERLERQASADHHGLLTFNLPEKFSTQVWGCYAPPPGLRGKLEIASLRLPTI